MAKNLGGPGGGLMAIGKSKAKVYVETDTKVTFADVAGVDEAKAELEEVVSFLRDPRSYGRLGARMPKGVLLVGPPGTGKTLLAKAIAGEADAAFFSISGSDFVEMFVGVATVCYLCVLAYRKIRQLDTQLLVISILLVTVVSTYFSVNGSGGPRYTFAPSIMIMLLVVGAVTDRTIPKAMRYVATLLVALSLTTSLMYYRSNMMGGVAYDPSWPKWRDELSVWRTDHAYPLGIWPPPWKMTLSGK